MEESRVCHHCGQEFLATTPGRWLCSDECRRERRRGAKRTYSERNMERLRVADPARHARVVALRLAWEIAQRTPESERPGLADITSRNWDILGGYHPDD